MSLQVRSGASLHPAPKSTKTPPVTTMPISASTSHRQPPACTPAESARAAAKKAANTRAVHACHKPARPATQDPFNRLLALVTPLTTESGIYSPGPLQPRAVPGLTTAPHALSGTKRNACTMQRHSGTGSDVRSASSCASPPITVSSLCGYLCKRGMHAAADEFLAAVCSAAEDSTLFDALPSTPLHASGEIER